MPPRACCQLEQRQQDLTEVQQLDSFGNRSTPGDPAPRLVVEGVPLLQEAQTIPRVLVAATSEDVEILDNHHAGSVARMRRWWRDLGNCPDYHDPPPSAESVVLLGELVHSSDGETSNTAAFADEPCGVLFVPRFGDGDDDI
eukprot:SAG11_NODE_1719_length_4381_cov_8.257823_4_plen_142_part_00